MAEQLADVSDTALLVAAARAVETEREDAIFRDPYAAALAGERGVAFLDHLVRPEWMTFGIGLRGRFIDEFLMREVASGAVDCVLCLGAGLDARPWRLDLPDRLRWVEVDFSPILDYKYGILKDASPRCRLERVAANLTEAAERRKVLELAAGEGNRVLLLTEGLLMYLPGAAVRGLASETANLGFRAWILDIFSLTMMRFAHGVESGRIERLRDETHLEGEEVLGAIQSSGWLPAGSKTFMREGREFAVARARAAGITPELEASRPRDDDPAGVWMFQCAV